jgi:hypothetical protein
MFYVIKGRRGDDRYYLVSKSPDEVSANMTAQMLNMGSKSWRYYVVPASSAIIK